MNVEAERNLLIFLHTHKTLQDCCTTHTTRWAKLQSHKMNTRLEFRKCKWQTWTCDTTSRRAFKFKLTCNFGLLRRSASTIIIIKCENYHIALAKITIFFGFQNGLLIWPVTQWFRNLHGKRATVLKETQKIEDFCINREYVSLMPSCHFLIK